jgi:hypothetical protein
VPVTRAMIRAVVLGAGSALRPGQIQAGHDPPGAVANGVLRHRRGHSRQYQGQPQLGLLRRLGAGIDETEHPLHPASSGGPRMAHGDLANSLDGGTGGAQQCVQLRHRDLRRRASRQVERRPRGRGGGPEAGRHHVAAREHVTPHPQIVPGTDPLGRWEHDLEDLIRPRPPGTQRPGGARPAEDRDGRHDRPERLKPPLVRDVSVRYPERASHQALVGGSTQAPPRRQLQRTGTGERPGS